MRIIVNALAALGMIASVHSQVYAGTVTCTGTVDKVAYHSLNGLMLKLSSMNTPVFICSADSQWTVSGTPYTTSPAVCKALYATFLAARVAGGTIYALYFDGDQVPASCNTWSAWAVANVRYFEY